MFDAYTRGGHQRRIFVGSQPNYHGRKSVRDQFSAGSQLPQRKWQARSFRSPRLKGPRTTCPIVHQWARCKHPNCVPEISAPESPWRWKGWGIPQPEGEIRGLAMTLWPWVCQLDPGMGPATEVARFSDGSTTSMRGASLKSAQENRE